MMREFGVQPGEVHVAGFGFCTKFSLEHLDTIVCSCGQEVRGGN